MAGVETRLLGRESQAAALSFLARDPLADLFLLDLDTRLGAPPAPGEARTEMVGAWRGGELIAVGAQGDDTRERVHERDGGTDHGRDDPSGSSGLDGVGGHHDHHLLGWLVLRDPGAEVCVR